MKLLFLALATMVLSQAMAQGPKTGKLLGHVDIGPIKPLERPGEKQQVPPGMYRSYTVLIVQPGPHNEHVKSHLLRRVAELKLSKKGDFSMDLAPGDYRVSINSTSPMFHAPSPKDVTIISSKTTRVTIRIDTGIR
ncbi:MAG: hypothetical protein ACHQ50_06085 [Fimbriimonadales bacterium]